MPLSDEELRSKLDTTQLSDVVCVNPQLLLRIRGIPEFKDAADAVSLAVVLPALETVPAAVKFHVEPPAAEAPPALVPAGFEHNEDGTWGSAFAPLAELVENVKTRVLADIQDGSPKSLARAEEGAAGLVAVGRLYKRIEPRHQFATLTVPGHERLVEFGIKLLSAAERVKSGPLADAACKLLIGVSFDRLCEYNITADFDVRKCRGLDDGWAPAPADADLHGIGRALLHRGPGGALSGLRVLNTLTSAERWLVAQTALGLVGNAVPGARDGSHTGPGEASVLREGLGRCFEEAEAGELVGILAAGAVIGFLMRSEGVPGLMRAGLGRMLVRAWRDKRRPVTSALAAYALSDMAQEARQAHSAPWHWDPLQSEEELAAREVPAQVQDAEAWRAQLRRRQAEGQRMKEEWEAGRRQFREELRGEGVALRPNTYKPAEEDPEAEAGDGALEVPPSGDAAVEAAWEALLPSLSAELAAKRPAKPPQDAWSNYCRLCPVLMAHYDAELEANEPGLYHAMP